MPAPLDIRVLNVTATEWIPIVVPFDCSSMAIKNGGTSGSVRMRTNSQDPATEDVLNAGSEQTFAVPFYRYRFVNGAQPLWLQAASGSIPVILKFLA
jgi:hypothetical protein